MLVRRCRFCVVLSAVFAIAAFAPRTALAGMPSPFPTLTDWGALRLSAISFFVVVVLLSALGVRWLWNALAADFPRLPQIRYRTALAAVLLWGLALVVVLTMIAGARELLTPGAWRSEGRLYTVAPPPPADPQHLLERQDNLNRFKTALLDYAAKNHGRFPPADEPSLQSAPWQIPGGTGMRYMVLPGRTVENRQIVAFEPALYDERLVLWTDGEVAAVTSAELRRQLGEDHP